MKIFTFVLLSLGLLTMGCTPTHPPAPDSESNAGGMAPPAPPTGTLSGGEDGGLRQRDKNATNASALFDSTTGRYNAAAVLTTVYFGFDKYNVEVTERAKLAAISEQTAKLRIIVAGYTDHFGTEQYNHGLSDRRAQSVKNYLVSLGTPDANIEIQAFGKQYARPSGSHAEVADDRRAVIVNADYKP
jgi:peptidoglycan-associated lipoprotein